MIKRNTLFKRVRLLMQLMVLVFWEISVNSANIQRINPYDTILKMLLKEPPVGVATNISTHNREYVQEMWLPQKVDHFAGTEHKLGNQTWMMRYYVNAEFYEPGGPILILVGGEWEITPSLLHQGHFYDMALQHNGIMFYTEHRYYGKSWPISSVSVDSLKYLSVLQSLEDLRYFIEYQKSYSDDLRDAKVVLVGCSYSGSMVAWFMKQYPNEADVAWASSAPLLAKIDFTAELPGHRLIYDYAGWYCGRFKLIGFGVQHSIDMNSHALKRIAWI
ncbi:putative serine protease K12H4.7 [Stomoxys calcitrans]|uniref:putative serine protease K12H4.7 n=1 Tax=Stomoxys calcitrans TaxID=35570 RepID=UPI0027E21EB1|nr:putative serine protease K12H4.7 [Stomoxys calcitrans]